MLNSWQNINTLRKTSIEISGGYYSEEYANAHGLMQKSTAKHFVGKPSVWTPELIEVSVNADAEILFRPKKVGTWYKEPKETFQTSCGTFISHNHGEFGGELITPIESLNGNFVEVFECGNIIYAIDSCRHMGLGHMKIYTFDEQLSANLLYSTKTFAEAKKVIRCISYGGLYVKGNTVYILATGSIERFDSGKRISPESKSFLFQIETEYYKRASRNTENMHQITTDLAGWLAFHPLLQYNFVKKKLYPFKNKKTAPPERSAAKTRRTYV